MKNRLWTFGALAALFMTAETRAAGVFYGLWWDGSTEQFVTIDPYTATKTVLGDIPGVKYIGIGGSYAFDPDSSRYAFVGYDAGMNASYTIMNAPTGDVIASIPKPDTIRSMIYDPGSRKAFGLSWSDTSQPTTIDSAHAHPGVVAGKEYFVSIDPYTGVRTNTYIPGVKFIRLNSHFLNPDSGRYVFAGQEDGGAMFYYVIDVNTGALVSKIAHTMKIDNPVYNPTTGAVHGLWWSDSSASTPAPDSSSGIPLPASPRGMEYFITLAADSTLTMTAIPGVKWITFNYTFDPDSQRYIFVGQGATSPHRYYVIDAVTGAVVSQTAVAEKIDNIAYARASSTIDSSFGPVNITTRGQGTRVARLKSFDGFLMLDVGNGAGENLSFSIRDVSGKMMLRKEGIQDGARIETGGLKNGIYLYQLRSGRSVLGTGKILLR
jgi:hypothetical protein